MNKKITILLSFIGLSFLTIYSHAQTINVIQGTTHTYTVTPVPNGASYNYVWTISGGTTSAPGTGNTTGNITWDGAPGQYTITVYAVDQVTGCAGNNQTLTINVVAMGGITLTGPAVVCPHTDNQSGDFNVTVSYSGTGAWSYTLNDGVTDRTINVADGTTSSNVVISGFANPSPTTPVSHTIRITSFTTSGGTVNYDGSESEANNHRVNVSVQPTPASSGITQN